MKTIIIEDEKHARDLIRNYLADYPDIELIAECENGFEGLKHISELKPDLIFLDIQMPKLNGFEMLELLEESPLVVFTTAFDEHAIKAFEFNATDYLLKPYSKTRFDQAIVKAREILSETNPPAKSLKNLIEYVKDQQETLSRIAVRTGSRIDIIPVDDVIYLEAQDDYVQIHTPDRTFLKESTMNYFETHLEPKDFVRIHRSFIVRIEQIKKIEAWKKDSHLLILKNNTKLAISKSGYKKLKDALAF